MATVSVRMTASFRIAVLLTAIVGCSGAPAVAQDRLYATGGWTTIWREPSWFPSFATPSPQPAASVPAVVAGAGVWLERHIAVEGTVTFYRAQSFPWHHNYLFGGNSDERATDRDVPVVGYLRIAPMRGYRVSIEPVVGGGFSWHRGVSFRTADCGTGSRPTPCVPVTPPRRNSAVSTAEWLAAVGADVAVRLAPRFDIAPGFRVSTVRRRQFLTSYDHRGPYSGGGLLPAFSVTVRYSIK